MLKHLTIADYSRTLNSKSRSGMQIHKHYAQCMHLLVSRWAARITPHQLAILMFVLDRTFYHDKLSETVVFDQFINGMQRSDSDEMVFCGLNMSKNTLTLQLKELTDGDFLHARTCIGVDGKTEIKARLFAINCKKLFNLDIADEENPMILREPKQKRVVARDDFDSEEVERAPVSALKSPRKARATPSNLTPPNLGGIYIYNTDTKVSIIGDAARAESSSLDSSVPTTSANVLDRVEQMRKARIDAAQQSRASRPTRTSKGSTNNPHSKANVQSIIDSAMSKYHPTLPRITVSEKPLGVLKKRIVAAQMDMENFLGWAIQFWTVTASGHERAARRRAGEESKYVHKPLPAAPDFTTLCYRFPYFASCFRSHLHTESAGLATTAEEQLQRKVEKLQRAVVAAKQDAAGAQTRERNLRRRMQEEPEEERPAPTTARIRRAPPTARPAINLDNDDDMPLAWDDHPATRKVR